MQGERVGRAESLEWLEVVGGERLWFHIRSIWYSVVMNR